MSKFALILGLLISVNAFAWREVGNGAGGIQTDGHYSTFFSANIPVKPEPLDASEIQGLDLLVGKISTLDISEDKKSDILFQIYPSGDRNYYMVDESKLDADNMAVLLKQYAATMHVPQNHVVIYALTDPKAQETYLMPAFFKLKPTEKAAILFHESLWIRNPDASYDQIISAEQTAQAFFEHPENNKYFYNFYFLLSKLTDTRSLLIYPMLKREQETGFEWAAKRQIVYPDGVFIKDLFGEKFMSCSLKFHPNEFVTNECSKAMLSDLILKSQKYPNSIVFKGLIDFIKANGSIAIVSFVDKNDYYQYQDYINNASFSLNNFDRETGRVKVSGGTVYGTLYFDLADKAH